MASKLATAQFGVTTGVIGPTALTTMSAEVTPAEKYSCKAHAAFASAISALIPFLCKAQFFVTTATSLALFVKIYAQASIAAISSSIPLQSVKREGKSLMIPTRSRAALVKSPEIRSRIAYSTLGATSLPSW
jgi:hypothetical protein